MSSFNMQHVQVHIDKLSKDVRENVTRLVNEAIGNVSKEATAEATKKTATQIVNLVRQKLRTLPEGRRKKEEKILKSFVTDIEKSVRQMYGVQRSS